MVSWPRSDIFSVETCRPWTTSFAAALASRSNLSLRVIDGALADPVDAARCTASGRRPERTDRLPRLCACAPVVACWALRSLRGASLRPCFSLSAFFSRAAFVFSRAGSRMFSLLRWIAGALPSSSPEHLEQVPPQAHLRWIVCSRKEDSAVYFCWLCDAVTFDAGVSSALRCNGGFFNSAAVAGWLSWPEHLEHLEHVPPQAHFLWTDLPPESAEWLRPFF